MMSRFTKTNTALPAVRRHTWMTKTTSCAILFRMKGGAVAASAAPAPRTHASSVCRTSRRSPSEMLLHCARRLCAKRLMF